MLSTEEVIARLGRAQFHLANDSKLCKFGNTDT